MAEAHHYEATFRNNIQDVPLLGEFIEDVARRENIDPAISSSVNLAIEEAVVNVMNYAYAEGTTGLVELCSLNTPEEWKLILKDAGKPFDPTQAEAADITLELEERPIGGLGIFLVNQLMDQVSYTYENGQNVLTMTKKL